MSQRECAGLNWPPPSIPAIEPVNRVPSEHRRMGWSVSICLATIFKATVAFEPSGRLPVIEASFAILDPIASPAVAVGHPARYACLGNWSFRSFPSRCATIPGVSFQSRALAVVQPANCATSCKSGPPAPRSARWLFAPPVTVLGGGVPIPP